jgi:hypothetical protein
MKLITIFTLLSSAYFGFAQGKITGHYCDHFGSRIELNADSTFKYTWHIDLSGSWTKGKWTFKNDTVYFQMIPTYDSVSYKNNNGTSADKLILSVDEIAERMTPEQYAGMGLSSGGQNVQKYPEKLFFKKGRLYKIYNRHLVVKKQKGVWTNKKWKP